MKHTSIILGAALAVISIIAGAVSMTINVTAGLSISVFTAVIYGVSDALRIIIPIFAAFTAWTAQLRLAFVAAIAVSLLAIATHLADNTAGDMAAKNAQSRAYREALTSVAAARSELAGIAETLPSATLAATIKAKIDIADKEEKNGGCLKNCIAAKQEVAALNERKGRAERREYLEAVIANGTHATSNGETITSGLAMAIADMTGIDKGLAERMQLMVAIFFAIFLMENAVYLIIPATKSIAHGLKAREDSREDDILPREDVREDVGEDQGGCEIIDFPGPGRIREDVREDGILPREDGREDEMLPEIELGRMISSLEGDDKKTKTMRAVLAMALQSDGYTLRASRRDLATMNGVSPTAMARWMKEWQQSYFQEVATIGNKTVWKLRAVR